MKLTKLKNGIWLDMSAVTAIFPAKEEKSFNIAPRVIIKTGVEYSYVIDCDTHEEACQLADEYAKITNS